MSGPGVPSRRGRRGEQPVVPEAEFGSYYGRPIVRKPVWKSPEIPAYLYLGGVAGASSVLAAGAAASGRPSLARAAKLGALGAALTGMGGLVRDLGRPARFLNMLRVFKPTSPMNMGSWVLSGYVPAAAAAAVSELTGAFPRLGAAGTVGAAVLGPVVASYTGALLADTAVPAWHDGYRELPYLFAASGAMGAAGLGLLGAAVGDNAPARRLAFLAAACELGATRRLTQRLGMVAEPYHQERAGAYLRASQALSIAGLAGSALLGRRNRVAAAASGMALLAASACTKWGVFHAGLRSASDPRYVVVPQRERLARREQTD